MDNQNVINAIYTIQVVAKDMIVDYNSGHYGDVFEDFDTIQEQLNIIKKHIKADRIGNGKLESYGNGSEKDIIVKDWYAEEYPDDADIMFGANDVSFEDTLQMMIQYGGDNFYDYIGVGDSVVRERIFEKLAEIYGVSYDDVYYLWLDEVNEISNSARKRFGI